MGIYLQFPLAVEPGSFKTGSLISESKHKSCCQFDAILIGNDKAERDGNEDINHSCISNKKKSLFFWQNVQFIILNMKVSSRSLTHANLCPWLPNAQTGH